MSGDSVTTSTILSRTRNTIITDPYTHLHFTPNPDGSVTRDLDLFPNVPPSSGPAGVLSGDFPINTSTGTWARVFLPKQALDGPHKLIPLVVYFHGGGFVVMHAGSSLFHGFCSDVALALPCVVVSVEYRLAPEHRLPAAYDDAVEAVRWVQASRDRVDWLRDYADYRRCFLMGSSAGGNIAYHAGLRIASSAEESQPLIKIKGLVLQQPFFGGVQRTRSEVGLEADPFLPPIVSDLMWDLALPVGVDRDHEYSNPTVADARGVGRVGSMGWRVLVTGCDGDPLFDRQVGLVNWMEEKGVQVVGQFSEGGSHGVDFMDASKMVSFFVNLKSFVAFCDN